MLFNSIQFLIFFSIVVIIYYIFNKKYRYIWLLFSSYLFYMYWNPIYAILLLFSSLFIYICAKMIGKYPIKKKIWLLASIFINVGLLVFFKYSNFIVDNFNYIFQKMNVNLNFSYNNILVPLGISFYTLKSLSYIIEVYKGNLKPENNFMKLALYISFFPQMLAGPITRPDNMLKQISEDKKFDYEMIKAGILTMLYGFFIKVVIADRLAIFVNNVFNNVSIYKGFPLIVAILFFSIQIYCDFSGYSLIAIGCAKILGFETINNFNRPYFSENIKNFWRRWHISLSSWFKDYIYIPLGGNRVSKFRKHLNVLIVFLVSGLWHGSSWTFIIWGLLHGLYQIFGDIFNRMSQKKKQKTLSNKKIKLVKATKILITFILVSFAWIFFRANNINDAFYIIKNMLNFNIANSILNIGFDKYDFIIITICVAIIFIIELFSEKINLFDLLQRQNIIIRWLFYFILIFIIIIFGVYGPGYDSSQFIYIQF